MDPKSVKTLDPKLKEVYDRVMGTQVTPAGTATPKPTPPAVTPQVPQPMATPAAPVMGTTPGVGSPLPSVSPMPAPAAHPSTPFGAPVLPTTPTPGIPNTVSPTVGPAMPKPVMPTLTPSPAPAAAVASVPGAVANKSAIDYAALAARYASPAVAQPAVPTATPVPGNPTSPAKPTVVTPSATTYGVVNGNKSAAPAAAPAKASGSPLKKVLMFVGIPVFLIAYTFLWIIIFKVDITKLLKF